MVLHRFDYHDGVIYHDADGQHHGKHCHGVDAKTQGSEERQSPDNGDRYGDDRDNRGTEITQKDKYYQKDQYKCLKECVERLLNGALDKLGAVVNYGVFEAWREAELQLGDALSHPLGGIQTVGIRQLVDSQQGGRSPVITAT